MPSFPQENKVKALILEQNKTNFGIWWHHRRTSPIEIQNLSVFQTSNEKRKKKMPHEPMIVSNGVFDAATSIDIKSYLVTIKRVILIFVSIHKEKDLKETWWNYMGTHIIAPKKLLDSKDIGKMSKNCYFHLLVV